MDLHWSVDYRSHQDSFDYEKHFTETLRQALSIKYLESSRWYKKKYRIFPNYWNGFSTHKENYQGAGNIEIEKKWNKNGWEIKGIQLNTDSAERMTFFYNQNLGITGDYQCIMENLRQDDYSKLEIKGRLQDGMLEIWTKTGLPILQKKFLQKPIYTNWCLLDRLPDSPFILLENLDSCYSDVQLQKLEDWEFEGIRLNGYVLSGYGTPFSYYWVNQYGHVVIASHTLMTYILEEAEFMKEGERWTTDLI